MVATRPSPPPLRVVIDTNVVLSALLFKNNGAPTEICHAWQRGDCVPVVSRAMAEELIRVLRYPKCQLLPEEQQAVLAEYLPHCETLPEPRTRVRLPTCRDPDDQHLLVLATATKADALITGDKDLLALRGSTPFEILSPAEFLVRLIAPE